MVGHVSQLILSPLVFLVHWEMQLIVCGCCNTVTLKMNYYFISFSSLYFDLVIFILGHQWTEYKHEMQGHIIP